MHVTRNGTEISRAGFVLSLDVLITDNHAQFLSGYRNIII